MATAPTGASDPIAVHSAGYVPLEFKEPGDPEPGAPG
jgi:hypothetical protein